MINRLSAFSVYPVRLEPVVRFGQDPDDDDVTGAGDFDVDLDGGDAGDTLDVTDTGDDEQAFCGKRIHCLA